MSKEFKTLQRAMNSKYSSRYSNLKLVMENLNSFLDDFLKIYNNKKMLDESFFPEYKEGRCKFLYLSEIANVMNIDKQYACRKLNCLCALQLIEKVDISKIKTKSVTVQKTLQIAKNQGKNPPNYFYVPKYNRELFIEAESRAEKLMQHGFSIRKFNKNMVKEALGEEEANNIFLYEQYKTENRREIKSNRNKQEHHLKQNIKNNELDDVEVLKHFNSLIIPNRYNADVYDVNVFYRNEKYVECPNFEKYLKKLNFKNLILDFLGIKRHSGVEFLSSFQKGMIDYNYNSFSEQEQIKYKWLIYDYTNYFKKIVNDTYFCKKDFKKYFIDREDVNKLNKQKNKEFIFNEKGYLVEYPNAKDNVNWHQIYHIYTFYNFESNKCKGTKDNSIDHLQKAPIYLYDIYINSIEEDFGTKKINKKAIKRVLNYKIVEAWMSKISNKYEAKANNCKYNLNKLSKRENSKKHWKIDDNEIIDIYKSTLEKDQIYVAFYFKSKQCIKINDNVQNIVALAVKYNSSNIKYEAILKELYEYKIIDSTENKKVNIRGISEYIQGKDVVIVEDRENMQEFSKSKVPFEEGMKNTKIIENVNRIMLE